MTARPHGRNPRHRGFSLGVVLSLGALVVGSGCEPPSTRGADGRPIGAKVYALHCGGCHGADGRAGKPEMRLDRTGSLSETALRRVILEGRGAMPAWKGRLAQDEVDAVVEHVRILGGAPG
jgi:mono/diheme cytochrome c family protein